MYNCGTEPHVVIAHHSRTVYSLSLFWRPVPAFSEEENMELRPNRLKVLYQSPDWKRTPARAIVALLVVILLSTLDYATTVLGR